ncbi:hypothetical protein ASC97_03640 [Rhizobium sp. Root1203]|uniref:hypothetical protein n=1 Tax=Rhizobium sp. Root1203 TaxID=1736427 RepID=UPI0007105451|nr:hypothetical protein [Rhizobium sp. Root1203]KQV27486.1 hypothetical protein ASC97_03640 [Rhizobium sp. Root1203]
MTRRFHRHDEPLTSEDLAKCQVVLEAFCHDNDVSLPSEEAIRVGAIIIEMYQQGIRDANHLRILVDAARGVVQKQGTKRQS